MAVDVTNTGPVAGKEVIQVYVHDRTASLPRPPKELKGFVRAELQPGATKTVTNHLDLRAFAFYHPEFGQWITEDGEFDILIGASSTDIRCGETVTLQSTLDLPSILTRMSTPNEWLAGPRGKPVFAPLLQQMMGMLAATFGAVPTEEGFGEEIMGCIMNMPLRHVLDFQGDALPASADEIVDGLLAQVHG